MPVTVNIVYFPGTNCQRETARAFERVGAAPEITPLADILQERARLDSADILCLPGGFSFGDHVGGGNVAAHFMTHLLKDQLDACKQRPILCICNGFQIGVAAGLFGSQVALTVNRAGTFNHVTHQRHVVSEENASFWLNGLKGETLRFPCAHGEGRLMFRDQAGWRTALTYPADKNPDGSQDDIAGITSADGMAFGLMDHPERAIHREQNLEFFRNGVRFVKGAA